MNSTSENTYQEHPYPLVRSGGLFLILIGGGIIIDVFFSGAFIVGTSLALISLFFAKALSFGKPMRIQIVALIVAIVLEMVLLIVMVNVLPIDIDSQTRMMWILIIVGVHFLPMAVSFGPRFALLGVLCMVNGFVGLQLNDVSSDLFLIIDGILKVAFGCWLYKMP